MDKNTASEASLGKHSRIDAAHRHALETVPLEPDAVTESVAQAAASAHQTAGTEHLERQASQLAQHLRNWRQDLDQRESDLNAQLAQHETDLRASRLWAREQQEELSERELELNKRQEWLEARERAVSTREEELAQHRAQFRGEVETRHNALAQEARRLQESQSALMEQVDELQQARGEFQGRRESTERDLRWREQRLLETATTLQKQERRLLANLAEHRDQLACRAEQAERDLAQRTHDAQEKLYEQHADLERREADLGAEARWLADARLELRAREQKLQRDQADGQSQLEELRKSAEGGAQERYEQLDRQQASLELREAALRQMKDEVQRISRETVELRLTLEHLWGQLTAAAPPAELTRMMAETRQRVLDQFRIADQELDEKKQELRRLAARLQSRGTQLREERELLQNWFERRNSEIEEQAVRLIARQTELNQQDADQQRLVAEWEDERTRLKLEIRELKSGLRKQERAKAA